MAIRFIQKTKINTEIVKNKKFSLKQFLHNIFTLYIK
jgi:hypothetical protein